MKRLLTLPLAALGVVLLTTPGHATTIITLTYSS